MKRRNISVKIWKKKVKCLTGYKIGRRRRSRRRSGSFFFCSFFFWPTQFPAPLGLRPRYARKNVLFENFPITLSITMQKWFEIDTNVEAWEIYNNFCCIFFLCMVGKNSFEKCSFSTNDDHYSIIYLKLSLPRVLFWVGLLNKKKQQFNKIPKTRLSFFSRLENIICRINVSTYFHNFSISLSVFHV